MTTTRRGLVRAGTALSLAAGLPRRARAALADGWPDRPVRLLVAFPPGASTDVLCRALAVPLTAALGQPVVVENRPGAGGNIATVAIRRAPPDGLAFLAHSVAYAVNPSLYRNAGYDALTDLEPVALLASTPNVITVNPARLDVRTLPELLAASRARALDYGSSGTGTTTHLGMEVLLRTRVNPPLGAEIQHVPFGPAQAITAVAGGQVPMASTSLPPALPLIREGRLRAIAVTGAARDPSLPEVPTVAESGFPGFEALTWFALMAPPGTPPAIADRMNAEVNRALSTPEMKARLDALGFVVGLDGRAMDRPALAAYLRREVATWADAVRASGATAD